MSKSTVKTAVATSPSMCRHCERSATKRLVWSDPIIRVDVREAEFCSEHFADMISILRPDTWDWENL